jgi:hypothetical protein
MWILNFTLTINWKALSFQTTREFHIGSSELNILMEDRMNVHYRVSQLCIAMLSSTLNDIASVATGADVEQSYLSNFKDLAHTATVS